MSPLEALTFVVVVAVIKYVCGVGVGLYCCTRLFFKVYGKA